MHFCILAWGDLVFFLKRQNNKFLCSLLLLYKSRQYPVAFLREDFDYRIKYRFASVVRDSTFQEVQTVLAMQKFSP
jgi:hypothetical protein